MNDRRFRVHFALGLVVLAAAGCSGSERTATTTDPAPAVDTSSVAPPVAPALPPEVLAKLRSEYSSPEMPCRYLLGHADLDEDGVDELLVHVVGPMACGTGGCPTLVYAPGPGGVYRLDSTIGVSRPPIRVAPRSTTLGSMTTSSASSTPWSR